MRGGDSDPILATMGKPGANRGRTGPVSESEGEILQRECDSSFIERRANLVPRQFLGPAPKGIFLQFVLPQGTA
ncbi:hypothetical protein Y1Q_0008342 [Alligator mississippiensis]|uniref:Uncharacterized protein n=1 Tax=Alligator mississippiensis TaxID=8496 RepID=A0A151N1U5_ALLMI|nr:hypothetical protein Y1Q_0008342 [Alligator mississippiensis]